jgi:large conductance mechanosensitive channel
MFKDFRRFLLRGNVVDLAVGVVIGAAFGTVISSLVTDLLTPLIGAIAEVPDFGALTFTLNGSTFAYGRFINAVISFVLVAGAVFFCVVKPMNTLIARARKQPPADPTTKKCPECMSEVPLDAKRCAYCTQTIA